MRQWVLSLHPTVQVVSKGFNNADVWAILWPIEKIYIIFYKPSLDNFGYMLWVVVLLEIE